MNNDIICGTPFGDKCGEIMICLDEIEFICNNPECLQSNTNKLVPEKVVQKENKE